MEEFEGRLGKTCGGGIRASIAGCADDQIERLSFARIVGVLLSPSQDFPGKIVGGYTRQFPPIVVGHCFLLSTKKCRIRWFAARVNRAQWSFDGVEFG